jgi:hypothetical protein
MNKFKGKKLSVLVISAGSFKWAIPFRYDGEKVWFRDYSNKKLDDCAKLLEVNSVTHTNNWREWSKCNCDVFTISKKGCSCGAEHEQEMEKGIEGAEKSEQIQS